MSKPTIHAHHESGPVGHERKHGNEACAPSTSVTVEFTLGDHEWALSRLGAREHLTRAYHEVMAQISDAEAEADV